MRVSAGQGGNAQTRGVTRCGNVWACPRCRAAILAKRRDTVSEWARWYLDGTQPDGYGLDPRDRRLTMLTLSYRHLRGERPPGAPQQWRSDRLRQERARLSAAYRMLTSGGAWTRFARDHDVSAVRILEVTHGRHGWHPHYHVLLGTSRAIPAAVRAWVSERWVECVDSVKLGPGIPRGTLAEHGAHWLEWSPAESRESLEKIVGYVVKEGFDSGRKIAKKTGSESPYSWLDAPPLSAREQGLWMSYARGMVGARQCTFPRKFMLAAGITDATDEAAARAADEAATAPIRGTIAPRAWRALTLTGLIDLCLSAMVSENDDDWWTFVINCPEHLLDGIQRVRAGP